MRVVLVICMIFVLGVAGAGCGLISRLEREPPPPTPPDTVTIAFVCPSCQGNVPAGPAPLEMVLYAQPTPQQCLWKINGSAVGQQCVLGYTFAQAGEYQVELITESAVVRLLVVAYKSDSGDGAVVTAEEALIACTQRAPREVQINAASAMRVDCLAKQHLDYIYYRADIGLCLLWEGENESMAINIPARATWSFTYTIYGVSEGRCPITGAVKTASGRQDNALTLTSTIAVKRP